MAYQPGYSGLLNSAFPRIAQYEASTGRRIRSPYIQGLLEADLASAKRQAMDEYFRNKQLDTQANLQQQQLDMQKKAQQDAQRSAAVSGVGQLAGLYGQYKLYDKYLAGAKPANTATTTVTTNAPVSTNLTSPTPTMDTLGGQGYTYSSTAGGAAPTVANTAQTQAVASPSFQTVNTADAGGAILAEDTAGASGASGTTGSAAGSSAMGTAGTLLGGAAAGYGAYSAADMLLNTGTGQHWNSKFAGASRWTGGPNFSDSSYGRMGKGFASGAAVGSVVPGIGTVVGGVVGALIGAGVSAAKEKKIPGVKIGGAHIIPDVKTVLCTELHRQCEITDRDLKWAKVFRMRHVSQPVYEGYLRWATPVVGLMLRSPLFNFLFKPVAKAIVRSWITMVKEGRYGFWCRVTKAVSLAAYRTPKMEVACG